MNVGCSMNKTELQACIKDLQYVLDNWDEWIDSRDFARIEDVPTNRGIFDVDRGLCHNVLDVHLDTEYKNTMFEGWDLYSGSTCYPVGGEGEYEAINIANLYCSGERMELARHCLDYMIQDLQAD